MEASKLYHWIEPDPTYGLILKLKDSEIEMLQLGVESMKWFIKRHAPYTNDNIEVIYELIDKISEAIDE